MNFRRAALVLAGTLLFSAMPILGHHALNAQYSTEQPITLRGTVTKIAWSNPHVRFAIQTEDASKTVMDWDLELSSPNVLYLNGWKIDTFKRGDHVRVNAYPARDGSNHGFATKVTRTTR